MRGGAGASCPRNGAEPSKRPVSYPCGPDSDVLPEVPGDHVSLTKRHSSDPLKVPAKAKTQVKPFTKESLERLQRKTIQLVREYGFQPKRKLSVEDGSQLPGKFEPFPTRLYGRPLEEIDNFIYDEVSVHLPYGLRGLTCN